MNYLYTYRNDFVYISNFNNCLIHNDRNLIFIKLHKNYSKNITHEKIYNYKKELI